jgi:hypothetical protein
LLDKGKNIVCTHKLFQLFDEEIRQYIEDFEYTLILDEVMEVINQVNISKHDINLLVQTGVIEVYDDGSVRWIDEGYSGEFNNFKLLSQNDSLFLHKNTFMFWTINKRAFESFKDVFILTYLFDGQIQKYYYDLHKMKYDKMAVVKNEDRYELIDYNPLLENRENIKKRLDIYKEKGKSKLNSNFIEGDKNKYILSTTWLKKSSFETKERLKKNVRSYFTTKKVNSKTSYWTTIKEQAKNIKSDRALYYETGNLIHNFVSLNIRATNEYKDCTACAYLYNRFMNPIEKNFFNFHGVAVDEDLLAVSDLIQFLFRGTIRNNGDSVLSVYIPSERMRDLLNKYLNYEI